MECFRFGRILLAADPGVGSALTQFLLLFAPLFLIWYLLIIRPQQRQRRQLQEMLANLKTGDRVVTSGGIYGTVVGFRDGIVQLQVANQVRLDVARAAISGLAPPEGQETEAHEKRAKEKKK